MGLLVGVGGPGFVVLAAMEDSRIVTCSLCLSTAEAMTTRLLVCRGPQSGSDVITRRAPVRERRRSGSARTKRPVVYSPEAPTSAGDIVEVSTSGAPVRPRQGVRQEITRHQADETVARTLTRQARKIVVRPAQGRISVSGWESRRGDSNPQNPCLQTKRALVRMVRSVDASAATCTNVQTSRDGACV